MDGQADHLLSATPSDFPTTWHYPDGSFYERDLDVQGTEVIYRFVGYVPRS